MTKILLVEDDKNLREIYGTRLYAEGYDIVSAGDGEQALAMAIKERPALIISDVMMPKISGFDMLDILRSTTETKEIKVIMMTALSSEDQRKRGESLGADRYLVKSQVGIEDVVRTVHDVLADAPGAVTGQTQVATSAAPLTPSPTASTMPAQTPEPSTPSPSLSIPPRSEPTAASAPVTSVPISTPPMPEPTASPVPMPDPTPVAPTPVFDQPIPASDAPVAAPTAASVEMPQPTAPFSTPRPANLGDRVIQPIAKDEMSELDTIADRMRTELGSTTFGSSEAEAPSVPAPVSNEPTAIPSVEPTTAAPTDVPFVETPRQTPPVA